MKVLGNHFIDKFLVNLVRHIMCQLMSFHEENGVQSRVLKGLQRAQKCLPEKDVLERKLVKLLGAQEG